MKVVDGYGTELGQFTQGGLPGKPKPLPFAGDVRDGVIVTTRRAWEEFTRPGHPTTDQKEARMARRRPNG